MTTEKPAVVFAQRDRMAFTRLAFAICSSALCVLAVGAERSSRSAPTRIEVISSSPVL